MAVSLRGSCLSATDQRFNAVTVCWVAGEPLMRLAMVARDTAPKTRAFLSRENTVSLGLLDGREVVLTVLLLLLWVDVSNHLQRGCVESPRLSSFTF
jgi:hypothetical protein